MNTDFRTPVDIANRALQHVGARRIDTMTDSNDRASEVAFVYDKLRSAELRRNVWAFATKTINLRPVDDDTFLVTFPTFSAVSAYPKFAIVLDTTGRLYQAQQYVSAGEADIDDNTAGSTWRRYAGIDTAIPYDSELSVQAGDLVYDPQDGRVFLNLDGNNDDDPTGNPPAWDATVTYRVGDTVRQSGVDYQSIANLNLNSTPPSANWATVASFTVQSGYRVGQHWLYLGSATSEPLEIAYPINSGPAHAAGTRNVFRLPVGFLREAPQNPKAGSTSYLGAPWGAAYPDWERVGEYLVSSTLSPFVYRCVIDESDVLAFDPMFCEMLACRIGMEVCERLTQSTDKLATIASAYKTFGTEARTINGIETGPTEPPEDDYIACRV